MLEAINKIEKYTRLDGLVLYKFPEGSGKYVKKQELVDEVFNFVANQYGIAYWGNGVAYDYYNLPQNAPSEGEILEMIEVI